MAADASACLAAAECLIITNTQYYIFISIFVIAAILLVLLLLVGFFTPSLIFLKAKFQKASLIYSVNRGQVGKFLIASNKYQGIADVKGVGPYIVTENSNTLESKSKTSFFFAFGEFAATLPLEFAQVVQYLRDQNKKVSNITDLAEMAGMEFDNTTKAWVKIPEDKLTEEQKKKIEEINIVIQPYKTINLSNLAYMFPFNITPALMESKTQHMIGLKMSMFNKMNMQYVLMFIMILMGVTLAAVIAFKFLQSGDTTGAVETRTVIERIVTTSGAGNLTG